MSQPLLVRITNFCGVQLTFFRADRTGDELALHDHPFDHLTMALVGTLEVFYADGSAQELRPGDAPIKFAARQLHGTRATAKGDCFVNITPIPAAT